MFLKRDVRRPVSRVLSRPEELVLRAGMAIPLGRPSPSASCDRPERRREGPPGTPANGRPAAPTWSCSRWGFPCRRRCRRRGALLPHRFTLAARRPCRTERRCTFCGTFPGVAPAGCYPAPHLRGARTFLPPHKAESGHPAVWHFKFGYWPRGCRGSCSWVPGSPLRRAPERPLR